MNWLMRLRGIRTLSNAKWWVLERLWSWPVGLAADKVAAYGGVCPSALGVLTPELAVVEATKPVRFPGEDALRPRGAVPVEVTSVEDNARVIVVANSPEADRLRDAPVSQLLGFD
jgi:hypothetical protein